MRTPLLLTVMLLLAEPASADWLTARSFHTHDEQGQRTHQRSEPPTTAVPNPAVFRTSGYSYFRSSLQYGPSTDHYHRVDQWGPPIQPYGEWRFPYRPYSVPYDQWGAPFAGLNLGNFGFPQGNFFPPGNWPPPNQGPGNRPGNFPANPNNPQQYYPQPGMLPPGSVQPWQPQQPYPNFPYSDGDYPDRGARPRLNDQDFYFKPTQ